MKKSLFLFPLKNILNLLPIILLLLSFIGIWIYSTYMSKHLKEGMNTINNEYTYTIPNTKEEIQFKINDVPQESIDMLNCLKIDYLGLVDASKAEMTKGYPEREYDTIISNTPLFKEIAKITDSSRQDMDTQWKKYFVANQLTPDIYTAFYNEMVPYSRDYYRIHSAIIRDNSENISEYTLVNYLMELMRKCRTSQTKLDKIKEWIIELLLPAEYYLKIIKKYSGNKKAFHTNRDLQYIINKTADIIRDLDYEKMKHTADKGILYIFSEETGKTESDKDIDEKERKEWELKHPQYISVDGMTIYTTAMIMNTLYSTIDEKIDFNKFKNMYSEYLTREGKPQSSIISVIQEYVK